MLPRTPYAMHRLLRYLLIAFALLFGQQAAQGHAISHLAYEFAGTQKDTKGKVPAGHPAAQCLLFHAIDSAPPPALATMDPVRAAPAAIPHVVLPLPFPPRIEFDSRAPPVYS